jgi:hypothetical protein
MGFLSRLTAMRFSPTIPGRHGTVEWLMIPGRRAPLLAPLLLVACRTPTQVTVELTTDVDCSSGVRTTLRVGATGADVDTHAPSVDSTACSGGRIGSLALVPSGSNEEKFAVKVVLAFRGQTPEECDAAERLLQVVPGCIVARREARFVSHTELRLPISLLADCDGVPCPNDMTCDHGRCVPAGHDGGGVNDSGSAPPDGPGMSCLRGAAATRYVDPDVGTDAPGFGIGFGRCAYRTLTYALMRETGEISLAQGTYSAASGEALPFVLRGVQQISCQGSGGTLLGKGRYFPRGIDATVVFEGYENDVFGCSIDGNGQPGVCIDVVASGSVASSNRVLDIDVGKCGDVGIQIEANVARMDVGSSKIHDNRIGVSWLGANDGSSLLSNTFFSNGLDISCGEPDVSIIGGGNSNTGNYPTCQTCDGCPF